MENKIIQYGSLHGILRGSLIRGYHRAVADFTALSQMPGTPGFHRPAMGRVKIRPLPAPMNLDGSPVVIIAPPSGKAGGQVI